MKIFDDKKELLLVLFLLLISGVSHYVNMFGFPYYENDEGNYMSQAWSVMREGKMAPYTYWYDHAPFGWITIAIWVFLTGGFFVFGTSVNSGRVLMLVLHVATTLFLYLTAKRITGKREIGVISVLIYSFSPLGIYYQRRVLLDNIMTFWLFASLVLIVSRKLKLTRIIMSAVFFGFAVLSKENAIFFFPVAAYLLWNNSSQENKKFSIFLFLVASVSIISTYFLYAFLKGELFPGGFLGSSGQHVSLMTTFRWQMERGAKLPFWNRGSDFYGGVREWLNKDPVIVVMGAVSLVVSLFLSIKKKEFRVPMLLGALFLIFLIRGGLVIGFYIVPLIPIFALVIAQVWQFFIEKISLAKPKVYRIGLFVSYGLIPLSLLSNNNGMYTRNETRPEVEALKWIKQNVPENAYMVVDDYMYVDLKEPGYINNKVYPNADWFWKIYYDPEIRDNKYKNDYRKIEYVVLSHEMLKQIGEGTQDYLKTVLKNSYEVQTWKQSTTSYLDFDKYISTNGDWMSIFERKSLEDIYLTNSWNNYRKKYIHSYGQVIDPDSGNTTSEGQSYAMLRAVWMGDSQTFDGIWKWSKDHLEHRESDMLLSWLWGKEDGKSEESVLDPNSAADADEDMALSLIFASKRFNNSSYMLDALTQLRDIWDKEVVDIQGNLILTSSPESERSDGYLINPSYLSPASYRIFAKVDTTHDWDKLARDSYYFLNLINNNFSGSSKLPPNWVVIGKDGKLKSARKYVAENADDYGYDAFRTYWRVALDHNWFEDEASYTYMKKADTFFSRQWNNKTKFNAVYDLNGVPMVSYEDEATTGAPISVFTVTNRSLAKDILTHEYGKYIYGVDDEHKELNYYDENWVWFTTALFMGKLPDLTE